MKFLLVVTFCSFLTSECPIQFHDDTLYEDWSSCMKEGINKSKSLTLTIGILLSVIIYYIYYLYINSKSKII